MEKMVGWSGAWKKPPRPPSRSNRISRIKYARASATSRCARSGVMPAVTFRSASSAGRSARPSRDTALTDALASATGAPARLRGLGDTYWDGRPPREGRRGGDTPYPMTQ